MKNNRTSPSPHGEGLVCFGLVADIGQQSDATCTLDCGDQLMPVLCADARFLRACCLVSNSNIQSVFSHDQRAVLERNEWRKFNRFVLAGQANGNVGEDIADIALDDKRLAIRVFVH